MPGRVPDSLEVGELAINSEDGALYFCDSAGRVHRIDATQASAIEVFTRWTLFGLSLFWLMVSIAVFLK